MDFTKGEGEGCLNQKLKYFSSKMSQLGGVLSNSLFSIILIPFRTFLELFEKTKLLKFENHSKELNFPSPSALFLQIKSKNFLNASVWRIISPPPGPLFGSRIIYFSSCPQMCIATHSLRHTQ